MADVAPGESAPTGARGLDDQRSRRYLRWATVAIVLVVVGMVGSIWLAQVAHDRQIPWSTHNRDVARIGRALQLAAATRDIELADAPRDSLARIAADHAEQAVRANLDTLAGIISADSADPAANERLAGIRSTIAPGRFDSLSQHLQALIRDEDIELQQRAASQISAQRTSSLVFLGGLVVLVVLVVQSGRHLARQLARAREAHKVIESQNVRLRTEHDALEAQTEQLQTAATELEIQAAELEEQTLELESTVSDLRDAEHRQHLLADDAALLARRLAEAQRVAQLGYWEIDSTTGDVFWSDEMYTLAGLDPSIKPPPTDRFIAAVHPDDRKRMQEVATRAVQELVEFTEQYRLPAADGPPSSWRTVQARGRVLVDERGGRKLVGTVQDITDRVLLETQLRRSQKMDAIGQLAGGIAHDFNNILTVIEGYSSLLLNSRGADDPGREDVEEIRSAAGRAATLTRQLLAFSRQQVLQPRVLDLNVTIGAVEKMLRRLIGENIDFCTNVQPDLGFIKADPGQLEQVIVNLVVNARDAMPGGGTLTIQTANTHLDRSRAQRPISSPGPHVMLSVTDTGTGIAPEHMERIFEPFFTTKESGKGTGLGLSTVHGIVEQSGGHIRVFSEVGKGTTFKLYFPRSEDEETVAAPASEPSPARRGSERILLVEDDASVRTVAGAILRRTGYTVVDAHDGLDALRICEKPDVVFDIVVSDMVMPGMGGRDMATHLRKVRPHLPILFMSGYTRDTMVHNSGLTGNESFIEKPFTPEILTQKVRDALDRAASRRV